MIQANDSALIVNDDDGILHILKHGFVGKRRKFDDLLAEHQPGIYRQHDGKHDWYERQRVRPETQVVGKRRCERTETGSNQQKQAAPMSAGDRRDVR